MSKWHTNWEPIPVTLRDPIEPPYQLSLFKPNEWGTEEEVDLGDCPYFARYKALPDHDPQAVCYQLGVCERAGEPLCITDEPRDGWPSERRLTLVKRAFSQRMV